MNTPNMLGSPLPTSDWEKEFQGKWISIPWTKETVVAAMSGGGWFDELQTYRLANGLDRAWLNKAQRAFHHLTGAEGPK